MEDEDDHLGLEEIIKDAEEFRALPREAQLQQLSFLARKQLQLEQQITNLEDALSQTKDALKTVSEGQIPELMNEIGMAEFKLTDGRKVSVKPFYGGRITDQAAYDWLGEHGHAEIIKGEVRIPYPKGFDEEKLREILIIASELGLTGEAKEEVHPMTLKAWIRTMIEGAREFPRDLFNVFTGMRTTIK